MKLKGIKDVFLPVRHLDAAAEWYAKQFQMHAGEAFVSVDHRRCKRMSFQASGFTLVESEKTNPYTHIPFNFHTENLDQLHRTLSDQGITVTRLADSRGIYCCDFYDPEGNRIGLVQETPEEQADDEVGATFLSVSNLDRAVSWYQEKLGYAFYFFDSPGIAGYAGPVPDDGKELNIRYAQVHDDQFETSWSHMCLVETPTLTPLVYAPYSLEAYDAESVYSELDKRNVRLSPIENLQGYKRFHFYDLDGNDIRIVEKI